MDVEQFKDDVRERRIDADRLVDLVVTLVCELQQAKRRIKEILDPETFAGIVVSDDAAVYANFTHSQKCWAHLLRKAIKLTLLEPANEEYRKFSSWKFGTNQRFAASRL